MKNKAQTLTDQQKRIPKTYEQSAIEFEKFKADELKRSRKMAWLLAGGTTLIAIMTTSAFLVSTIYRTEPEPVVIAMDKSTGMTTMMRSLKDGQDQYDEVVNKHFLQQYVTAREYYDWYMIGTQYKTIQLMSTDQVFGEYDKKVKGKNQALEILKDKGRIRVTVGAMTPVGDLFQVHYTTEKVNMTGENLDQSPIQSWVATIAFKFDPQLKLTEQERRINPLGFKVLSYRVDAEVTGK
ncbi:virB8 family protein [Methylotenera sp.]|uniref:virB8 family protein n=1 Tax=Methylotenera sp. TaxID=2051956 RepID=UPI002488FF49|nr:type IV secretion system protein [Methylotenera sp.]MDI1298621.1 type IV secretion system protein [Methylotenera sp.]